MFHVKQFILGFCFQNVSRETFLFLSKILFKRFVVQFQCNYSSVWCGTSPWLSVFVRLRLPRHRQSVSMFTAKQNSVITFQSVWRISLCNLCIKEKVILHLSKKIGFVFLRLTGEMTQGHNLDWQNSINGLNRKIQRICNFAEKFTLFYIHFSRFPL